MKPFFLDELVENAYRDFAALQLAVFCSDDCLDFKELGFELEDLL